MRIDLPASPLAAGAWRAARRTRRAGDFALPDAPEEQDEAAPAMASARQAGAAGCLLAAEGVELSGAPGAGQARREAADRAAASQGRALLGALAGLQMAGLGEGGVQARETLADLARALPQAADPRLDEVLRAIAQRAAIELARAG